MSEAQPEAPAWPARLAVVCEALHGASNPTHRNRWRTEAWLLLNTSLRQYVRAHASRLGRIRPEDVEDIAASKSLDLMCKAESGRWSPAGRSTEEIVAYLSASARNGLVDLLRDRERFRQPDEAHSAQWLAGRAVNAEHVNWETPELEGERRDFALAVRDCAARLQARARKVWFFRAFYDMSSKEIAAHPEIALKPGHVDVLLQRTRQALKECLAARGYESQEMPPGCFAEIWESMTCEGGEIDAQPAVARSRSYGRAPERGSLSRSVPRPLAG
jgi:RNA polymerase sigma factor (sigma-70 family)